MAGTPPPAAGEASGAARAPTAGGRGAAARGGPVRLRRPFYGWWIVAAGSGIHIMFAGLLMQAFGAYAAVLREEFGWSRALVSGAFALARVESGLLGPLQGWMLDRFGPPAIMRVGLVLFGIGFMLFSQLDSPATFYATFFLIAIGSSLGGPLAITVAIVNWFERRRATALGISQVGFAIGGLLVPLTVLAMETWGWRWTAFGSGVLIIAVGMPLSFIIRHRPEPYGYTVDGRPPEERRDHGDQAAAAPADSDFTAREAMRTRAFWMVSLGHGSALLVVSAVMVHLFLQLTERLHYSLGEAALFVSLLTVMQMGGQVFGASLGDRFEKRVIIVICMVMHMVGLLLLAFADSLWMVVAFSMLHGLAWGTRGPLMMAIRADYFGRSSYGTIMGFSSVIVMMGMMGGPLLAGFLADRTGNYEVGFTVLALAAGLGSVFFIFAPRPAPPARLRRPTAPAVTSGRPRS
ncbi:MAG: MFS transporter [Chloroflexi bacterium]|nr:MFS transporter [Chloroflexota bacterium]